MRRNARSSRWIAFVAAYVLVLQALFAGLAAGALAGSFTLDRSLSIALCAPGSEAPPSHAGSGPMHSHADPSCCTAGCQVIAGDAPLRGVHRQDVHRPVDLVSFIRRLDVPVGYLAGYSPANPRAPPVLG